MIGQLSTYRGIVVPLVTPIDSKGNVCEESIGRLVAYVRHYSFGLMPALSSGEGWKLTYNQWKDFVISTNKYSDGLTMFVGVEFPTTREVLERSYEAMEIGANAVVVTTPFKPGLSQQEIYKHFKELAERKIPIFIYNEEAISGNSIEYPTLLDICSLGNVVGIKEASGNPKLAKRLVSETRIPVFQGWEHLLYETHGVAGYILPISNIEPELCFDMLSNPTKEKQERINTIVDTHNVSDKQWYLHLKKELKRRGIISEDYIV